MEWETQKVCTDIGDYELIVEKQKRDWECAQDFESWKWSVVYNGSIIASGSVNSMDEAKVKAEASVPDSVDADEDDCACEDD